MWIILYVGKGGGGGGGNSLSILGRLSTLLKGLFADVQLQKNSLFSAVFPQHCLITRLDLY